MAQHGGLLHDSVVVPLLALLSEHEVENRTAAPWILAERSLGIAALVATLPWAGAAAAALGDAVERGLPERFAAASMERLRAALATGR